MKYVQSAITSIGLPRCHIGDPETTEAVEGWLEDIYTLLDFESGDRKPLLWTAPRWMMPGDVLFFYMTKSSENNSKKPQRSLDDGSPDGEISSKVSTEHRESRFGRTLNEAVKLAEEYAGTIFACGKVTGGFEFILPDPGYNSRFKSNVFAPWIMSISSTNPSAAMRSRITSKSGRVP